MTSPVLPALLILLSLEGTCLAQSVPGDGSTTPGLFVQEGDSQFGANQGTTIKSTTVSTRRPAISLPDTTPSTSTLKYTTSSTPRPRVQPTAGNESLSVSSGLEAMTPANTVVATSTTTAKPDTSPLSPTGALPKQNKTTILLAVVTDSIHVIQSSTVLPPRTTDFSASPSELPATGLISSTASTTQLPATSTTTTTTASPSELPVTGLTSSTVTTTQLPATSTTTTTTTVSPSELPATGLTSSTATTTQLPATSTTTTTTTVSPSELPVTGLTSSTATTTQLPATSTTTSTTTASPSELPVTGLTSSTATTTQLPATSTTTTTTTVSPSELPVTGLTSSTATTTQLPATSTTTATTTVSPSELPVTGLTSSTATTTQLPATSTTTTTTTVSPSELPVTGLTSSTATSTTTTTTVSPSEVPATGLTSSTATTTQLPATSTTSSTAGPRRLSTQKTESTTASSTILSTVLPTATASSTTTASVPSTGDASFTGTTPTSRSPTVAPVGDGVSATLTSVSNSTAPFLSPETTNASARFVTPVISNMTLMPSTETTSVPTTTEGPPLIVYTRTLTTGRPREPRTPSTIASSSAESSVRLLTESTPLFKATTATLSRTKESPVTGTFTATSRPNITTANIAVSGSTPSLAHSKITSPTETPLVNAWTEEEATAAEAEMTSTSKVMPDLPRTPSTNVQRTTVVRVTTSGRVPQTTARLTHRTQARPSTTARFRSTTGATAATRMTTTMKPRVSSETTTSLSMASTTARPPVSTTTVQMRENVSHMLLMSGDCSVLKQNPQAKQDFEEQLKTSLKNALNVKTRDITVNDIVCGSINVSLTFMNVSKDAIREGLRDFVDSPTSQIVVYSEGNSHAFRPVSFYELAEVVTQPPILPSVRVPGSTVRSPKTTPLVTQVTEGDNSTVAPPEQPSIKGEKGGLSHTDLLILIIVSIIGGLLIIIIIALIAQECRRRSHTKSFDLRGTPRARMDDDDFTLTKLDRPPGQYNDHGLVMHHTQNGHKGSPPRTMDTVIEETEIPQRLLGAANGKHKGGKDHVEVDPESVPDSPTVKLMATFPTSVHQGVDNPSFASEDMLDSGTETDKDNLSSEISHDLPTISPDILPVAAPVEPQGEHFDEHGSLPERSRSSSPSDKGYEETYVHSDVGPSQSDVMLPVSGEVEYPNDEIATLERPHLLKPLDANKHKNTYEMVETNRLSKDPSLDSISHEGATAF